jgi:hypothetical protein
MAQITQTINCCGGGGTKPKGGSTYPRPTRPKGR